jgi:hypothetical protein
MVGHEQTMGKSIMMNKRSLNKPSMKKQRK